jgi:hypothetical protein
MTRARKPRIAILPSLPRAVSRWLGGEAVHDKRHCLLNDLRNAEPWLLDDLGIEIRGGKLHIVPTTEALSNRRR